MDLKKVIAVGCITIAVLVACENMSDPSDALEEARAITDEYEEARKLTHAWRYEVRHDEMRGATTKVALIRADGGVALFEPDLYIFNGEDGHYGASIAGQLDPAAVPISCDGSIMAKFDDGPLQEFPCQRRSSVTIDPVIIQHIRNAKTTWIETETYYGSREQFKFKTADLRL